MKASARTLLRVELHGVDLPGRSCGPRPGGGWYEDIQVGLKRGTTAIDLVPGDAPEAKWFGRSRMVATSAARSSTGTATIAILASVGTGGVLTGASRTSAARSCASPRSTSDCVVGREP